MSTLFELCGFAVISLKSNKLLSFLLSDSFDFRITLFQEVAFETFSCILVLHVIEQAYKEGVEMRQVVFFPESRSI